MGDIADMMLDGTLCASCGEYIGNDTGVPCYCSSCAKHFVVIDEEPRPKKEPNCTTKNGVPIYRPNKTNCPICNKLVKKSGLDDHLRVKHVDQYKVALQHE